MQKKNENIIIIIIFKILQTTELYTYSQTQFFMKRLTFSYRKIRLPYQNGIDIILYVNLHNLSCTTRTNTINVLSTTFLYSLHNHKVQATLYNSI